MDYHREFANLDGETIKCTYTPLTRRESWDVEYNSVGIIAAALGNAYEHAMPLLKDSSGVNVDITAMAAISKAITAIHSAVPFSVIDEIACRILRNAIIQRPNAMCQIGDKGDSLHEVDFFDDRLDDLLLCVFWGLDVSYPRTFSKARGFLDVLKRKAPGETTSKESNTASKAEPPSSSPSRNTTG